MPWGIPFQLVRARPFSVKVTDESLAAYKAAAALAGMTVSEWVRLVLDAAAGRCEMPEQLQRVVRYETRVRDGKW